MDGRKCKYCDVPRARAVGLAPGASATSLSLFVGTSTVPVVDRRLSGSSALCRARFPMMDRELCRAMG